MDVYKTFFLLYMIDLMYSFFPGRVPVPLELTVSNLWTQNFIVRI